MLHLPPSFGLGCWRVSNPDQESKYMLTPKQTFALGAGAMLLLGLIPVVARAVRTDVSRDFPVYHNHGQPDLTIDPKRLVSQLAIVDRFFDSSSCEIIEGSVGRAGYRLL